MKANIVRNEFLTFFRNKSHKIVDSAPIVVKDDPTLMFINAGMNPFKDYFLGNKVADAPRIADTQRCLRVSGKHNDLEEVGVDTYHHTLFEMLGNWSFGDYFKEEAIAWAWEFLTEVAKLDKSRLYATVFEGNAEDKLEEDKEAIEIWKKHIPSDRIIACDKKDNFWEMGDVGPCGPCSEIHIDLRSDEERAEVDGLSLVNKDHPQVIEIWNLVFMQFNRKADGSLENLPNQHVDTGMGFERLVRAIQGKTSNYDTDIFMPLINTIERASNKVYGKDETLDIAMRVIADHIRAIAFTIADGQLPSNNGAGYVIRRILRRAVRYGYTFLGFESPFMGQLIPVLMNQFEEVFPNVTKQEQFITKVIKEEEAGFFKTLSIGLQKLQLDKGNISGTTAFELYDTYGFPLDLTQLIAQENGVEVDVKGFEEAMAAQKARSRNAESASQSDWIIVHEDDKEEFIGYDHTTAKVKLTRYREVKKKDTTIFHLVFNFTPFYAEGGGQVGDTGYIQAGDEKVSIVNTVRENQLIIHIAKKLPSNPKLEFEAFVNEKKRVNTNKNHSATHLLHEALRDILGTHVEQRGSLVNDVHLRFDFSHFQKMTEEEIKQVEKQVNEKIWEGIKLNERRALPINEAKDLGAMALFGEKYGDLVRVIQFGSSVELCGGTHVSATSEIGLFKITSESSIAAGIRRIEAVTGVNAMQFFNEQETLLNEVNELLKTPVNTVEAISKIQEENALLKKQLAQMQILQAGQVKAQLLASAVVKDGASVIIAKTELQSSDQIKNLAFQLKNELDSIFLVLAAAIDGKALLTVMVSEDLGKSHNLHAGNIVRELAKEIKGGGGGQPFYATAGGKDITGIPNALEKAKELF